MESWSAEEDNFSFLRTAPLSFSLRHQEGPNRVEIFDITNIPSHRTAISETTCLCDIFGDDCESPVLSSSPVTGSPAKREEEEFTLADDTPNDSPGSYHTAPCSEQLSDSSDTYEDSKEALTPEPQVTTFPPEARITDTPPKSKGTSPSPEHRGTNISSEPRSTNTSPELKGTSPSPEHRGTNISSEPRSTSTSPELKGTSPSPEHRSTNISPELRSTAIPPELKGTSPLPEHRDTNISPEPRITPIPLELECASPSPEHRVTNVSPETGTAATQRELNVISPSPEPRTTAPSPKPRDAALSSICRTTPPLSERKDTTPSSSGVTTLSETSGTDQSPKSRGISPSPEDRGINISPESRTAANSPEFKGTPPSPEPRCKAPTPKPGAIAPSHESKGTVPSPEPRGTDLSPEPRGTDPITETRDTDLFSERKAAASSPKSGEVSPSTGSGATIPSSEPTGSNLTLKPAVIVPSTESKNTNPFPKTSATTPSSEPRGIDPSLKPRITDLSPDPIDTDLSFEPQSKHLSHENQDIEFSSQDKRPTSIKCKRSPHLSSEVRNPTPENSDTAILLEPTDTELLDTNLLSKPWDKDREKTTATLANTAARKGLCSPQAWFTSETILIQPSGNQQKHAETHRSPSETEAPEGTESVSSLQNLREDSVTSRESPTECLSRDCDNRPFRDREKREGEEEEQKREEQGGEEGEGEGKQGKASYGEQQVELSFSARNRKAPASPNSAPTYREPQSGMPARCYSDCLLVTQQQQQQQQPNPLRAQSSQKENQVRARKPQAVPQVNRSSAIRSTPDCSSETSSMGSELDEADNEVKWFTDLAFRSLSSPQADYLDVYNSSHRSSTNVSQLSTEDSPGGNAWSAYADLRGSAQQESNELSHQPPVVLPTHGLDAAKRFEMGSYECVDVALESREEVRRGKRTVPKRQIQLKRRDTSESRASENSEVTAEVTTPQRRSRDTFLRQHSTPAAIQEEMYRKERESDPGDRKQKLQKSLSLEETSSKNKMASCLIKSVLSKKMQHEHRLTNSQVQLQNGHSSPPVVKNVSSESSYSVRETPKTEVSNLSSGLTSDCSLSSEDLPLQAELSPQSDPIKLPGIFGSKPQQKPAYKPSRSPLPSNRRISESQKNNSGHLGMRSELIIPFDSKKTEKCTPTDGEKQQASHNLGDKHSSDSANASAGNTGTAATRAVSVPSGMTNREKECHTRPENYKQQSARNLFMSKTPEITLKPCTSREKKKSSLKVGCISADLEMKPEESCEAPSPDRTREKEKLDDKVETKLIEHTGNEEANEKTKTKAPMHKVRDVRKLVKNTYNLSFKATAVSRQDSISPGQMKKLPLSPPPMQIECKAISRRDERAAISQPDEKQKAQEEKTQTVTQVSSSQVSSEKMRETASLLITPRSCLSEGIGMSETRDKTPGVVTTEINSLCMSGSGDHADKAQGGGVRHPRLGSTPKLPSKDREVATLLFLQEGVTEDQLDPMAPPPLSLTATSSSRSVSMLLKEKGFQADIGVCDALGDAAQKHVNRLEVPLQTCSMQETPAEPYIEKSSDPSPPPARTSPSGSVPRTDAKDELHQKALPQTRELERTSLKPKQRDTKPQDIAPSSPPKPVVSAESSYSLQQTEVTTMSSYTKKTAVNATSSCKQQQSLTVATHPPSYTPKSTVSATSGKMDEPPSNYKQKPAASSNPQQSTMEHRDTQEQVTLVSSCSSEQSTPSATTQAPSYSQQQAVKATPTQRKLNEDFNFYASDDPPSYDERESFSPLMLTDLPPRKLDRYHPTIKAPPCSCITDSMPSPGPPDLAPPTSLPSSAQAPPSQIQAPPSLAAPPPARLHQKRPDVHSLSYQPESPQTTQPSSTQPPATLQPLHQPPAVPACPAPMLQPRPEDSRQPPPVPHTDRRVPRHRSPQQPAQPSGGGPYSSAHSPSMPSLEVRPQYLCSPQGFVSSFSPEYGGEGGGSSGVLYPEGGGGLAYGQSPRRVLLDPETGKYFYIEVPVQPLRKMLFDPETGQYVEVLIPQQALSHSGLYPPVAAPYPSLHNTSMYAPQYLPYGVPPHPQPPSPRHPDAPAAPGLHQSGTGFGSPAGQGQKSEPQNHPPLDQSYLESMYYIPTGMTASPNPAPSDFYHKLPPNLPNSGGKRS